MLFQWVYCTSSLYHYIEENICFYLFRSSHWLLQNSCSKSLLYQFKTCLWKCFILINLNVSLLEACNFTKIELVHWYFSKFLIMQSAWYSAKKLFWRIFFLQNTFFNWCFDSLVKLQWLLHTFFSYWNFSIQFSNLAK